MEDWPSRAKESPKLKRGVVGLMVPLALLVPACAGADDGQTETTQPLPGTQAFGLTDQEFTTYVEEVESLIAECMAGAGFEYVPVDVTAVLEVGVWRRADPNMSREEFKREWGYGISTRVDDPAREVGLGDQNVTIYEGLTESEKIAYERTLFGEDPDATFALTLDDEDFSGTGGCTEEAVTAVFPAAMLTSTFINPKDVLVESDPRVTAAEQDWMDCMGEDAYEYEDQDEIIEEFEDRYDELLDGKDLDELSGDDLVALEELQSEEIAVAMKDLECQALVDPVIREVEIEIYGEPVSG